MTLVALIDPNICTGHGDCEQIAPEIFHLEDDVAVVIGPGPDELLMAESALASMAVPALIVWGTDDLFFIVIEKADPRYDAANTTALLERVGGREIKELES